MPAAREIAHPQRNMVEHRYLAFGLDLTPCPRLARENILQGRHHLPRRLHLDRQRLAGFENALEAREDPWAAPTPPPRPRFPALPPRAALPPPPTNTTRSSSA